MAGGGRTPEPATTERRPDSGPEGPRAPLFAHAPDPVEQRRSKRKLGGCVAWFGDFFQIPPQRSEEAADLGIRQKVVKTFLEVAAGRVDFQLQGVNRTSDKRFYRRDGVASLQ